ncbi:MAG: 4-alpha-glucanotransferase, partial [Bacteroidia bacterium]
MMIKVVLYIHYQTNWGQQLCVSGNISELGNWRAAKALEMEYTEGSYWTVSFETDISEIASLQYKYFVKESGQATWEFGENRSLSFDSLEIQEIVVRDYWRAVQLPENVFHTAAFTQAIMKPDTQLHAQNTTSLDSTCVNVMFQLRAPRVEKHQQMGLLGNHESLGAWDESKVIWLAASNYPTWNALVPFKEIAQKVEYKYLILDTKTNQISEYETGENRVLEFNFLHQTENALFLQNDEVFRYAKTWKGTGVAMPVFSLRSKQSNGVGEFTDLTLLIDWAKNTGLKMVQLLPVNDTVANHTWQDSYPYAAISVFALHPLYINLQKMGALADARDQKEYEGKRADLNALSVMDYEGVMNLKSWYFKKIDDQQKSQLADNKEFHQFIEDNSEWLKPYAAFSHLRDLYNTPD